MKHLRKFNESIQEKLYQEIDPFEYDNYTKSYSGSMNQLMLPLTIINVIN
jgi:hypothetical protein